MQAKYASYLHRSMSALIRDIHDDQLATMLDCGAVR